MEDIAAVLEDSYERMHVWQALVVVGTDDENAELTALLEARGFPVHSVRFVEPGSAPVPPKAALGARVLVLTYAAWWQAAHEEQAAALEEAAYPHNLLLLDPDLDSPAQDRVLRWASGCLQRGFWREGPYRCAIGDHFSDVQLRAQAQTNP